jgi:hypothetical protein
MNEKHLWEEGKIDSKGQPLKNARGPGVNGRGPRGRTEGLRGGGGNWVREKCRDDIQYTLGEFYIYVHQQ